MTDPRPEDGSRKKPSDRQKPHYTGHRDRLRSRFLDAGIDALADYELLELILFRAIPRRDVKPLAKDLLAKFGGFAQVINAPPEQLKELPGVGDAVITEIKIVEAAALQFKRDELKRSPDVTRISSWNELQDYCQAKLAHQQNEQFHILFLDRKNVLIEDEKQQEGTVDHTPVYTREVVKRALHHNASAIILVHNHPSGDPTPSKADIQMTRQIQQAVEAVNIRLHDHLIIGRTDVASFQSLGLLKH